MLGLACLLFANHVGRLFRTDDQPVVDSTIRRVSACEWISGNTIAEARDMRLRKTISLVAVAGMMAGCTSTGGVRQPSAPETVAPEKALVLP
ncbi:cellulose biosynthesis protein BcsN, partial [Rhizobium ruizarguesonis]